MTARKLTPQQWADAYEMPVKQVRQNPGLRGAYLFDHEEVERAFRDRTDAA